MSVWILGKESGGFRLIDGREGVKKKRDFGVVVKHVEIEVILSFVVKYDF